MRTDIDYVVAELNEAEEIVIRTIYDNAIDFIVKADSGLFCIGASKRLKSLLLAVVTMYTH